jgi:lipopolysaccharide transport system permease protein
VSLAGFTPGTGWVVLPLVILVQILLILACALITAAITPFLPDFRFIVNTGMTMLMLSSGIFYDYRQIVLEEHREFFLLNPMVRLIEAYRDVMIRDASPDWAGLAVVAAACAVVIGMLLAFFRRNDAVYARLVIE